MFFTERAVYRKVSGKALAKPVAHLRNSTKTLSVCLIAVADGHEVGKGLGESFQCAAVGQGDG
jgi:hypothetical protein